MTFPSQIIEVSILERSNFRLHLVKKQIPFNEVKGWRSSVFTIKSWPSPSAKAALRESSRIRRLLHMSQQRYNSQDIGS